MTESALNISMAHGRCSSGLRSIIAVPKRCFVVLGIYLGEHRKAQAAAGLHRKLEAMDDDRLRRLGITRGEISGFVKQSFYA